MTLRILVRPLSLLLLAMLTGCATIGGNGAGPVKQVETSGEIRIRGNYRP